MKQLVDILTAFTSLTAITVIFISLRTVAETLWIIALDRGYNTRQQLTVKLLNHSFDHYQSYVGMKLNLN